ncbi:P-loop NTPase [Desulfurivibrio sp. D14AmB]|uniref:P-loop NTPase n=1 Tax=Desulfurivibrio sp. D14AmB TaxID=3374370 RepID=UPI00376F296C
MVECQKNLRSKEIWAIGGGKGGIGKSLIIGNAGITLARLNKKVLLVDADLGGANLHTTIGMGLPEVTLSDFLKRRTEKIQDVVIPTGIPNLSIISGARDILDAANPHHAQKERLLRQLNTIDADYILLDIGAGTSYNILDFFLFSNHGVLVVLPEPTAIENAYRFIKSAFYRRFRKIVRNRQLKELVDSAKDQKNTMGIRTPYDLIKHVKMVEPAAGELLELEMRKFKPKLIVNQARGKEDIQVGFAMRNACETFFGISLEYLGYLEYDDCIWRSVRSNRPLVLEYPGSGPVRSIESIVRNLLGGEQLVSGTNY